MFKYQDTINKIMIYLKDSGWDVTLKYYWESEDFKKVITSLHEWSEDDKKFVPRVKDMFRFMIECPFSEIKCVLFIDDVNHTFRYVGIPYCQYETTMSTKKKLQVDEDLNTKENRREEIEQFIIRLKRDKHDKFDYNLTHWCKQGVLMLPYFITNRIGLISTEHANLWKEFRARIIEEIGFSYPDIPWVLVNPKLYKYRQLINSKTILNVNVTTYGYKQNNYWPFWINSKLQQKGISPIVWNREDKYPFKEEQTKLQHINFGYSILKGYF